MWFIGKLGGGIKPLGLLCTLFRVFWGQLRKPLTDAWLREHAEEFWWAASEGKACDRAGWEHALVAQWAQAKSLSAASVFLDIRKF